MKPIPAHSRERVFAALTGFLLLCFAVLILVSRPTLPADRVAIGLFSFAALAVLMEAYPLSIPLARANLALSGTIFTAIILLFNPAWAALAAASSVFISEILFQERSITKKVFNSVQSGISVLLAGTVFLRVVGESGLDDTASFFLGAGAAFLTYWMANTWLVSTGAAVLYKDSAYRFWLRNFRWAFVYELTSAPIALAVAYAYQELWLVGLFLLSLPIFMVRLAYSQYLELKKTYRETVRTLVKIIEMHDPYTAGHSDRVATYARRLCEALRVQPGTTEKIELAAFLHDLGKIHLDLSSIIRKAGRLTDEERRLIKLHSVVSADLANQVSYFKGEIEGMIRHHHENWDGTGYPHGLKGEQIPLGSRIILLADAFDAMTTSRVYRDALDLEKVKNEFRRFAGVQFDPKLVPVFLDQIVGDGSGLIRQPMSEPIEGQRAAIEPTTKAPQTGVRELRAQATGLK